MSKSKGDSKDKNPHNNGSKNKANIVCNNTSKKSSITDNDSSDSDGNSHSGTSDGSLCFRVSGICVAVWSLCRV